mgnify:CR=1 FL=1
MFLIVVIKLLLPLPSSKANKEENKITFLVKAMMRRRRNDAIIVINQAITLENVEKGNLVKRRKNNLVLILPPLLI